MTREQLIEQIAIQLLGIIPWQKATEFQRRMTRTQINIAISMVENWLKAKETGATDEARYH